MRVLVACEFSGTVRDAFIKEGHDAWSCDLLPTERFGPHYQDNIFHVLTKTYGQWDLMIAHPPCTYLCNSGVSWLYRREDRWVKMVEGARSCMVLQRILLSMNKPQVIQPWMFGIPESKATCLWLKNLRPLIPTKVMSIREQRLHKLPPSPDRWKLRSKTYPGIAKAMAEQWGVLK